MIVRRLPDSELYHHGIKGQEWGEQNGPPYPLDRQTSAAVKRSAKKKSFFERARDRKKMKKLRDAKIKKKKETENKEKAIRSGNVKDIEKIKHTLTDEELTRAVSRIQMDMSLTQAKSAQNQARFNKIKNIVETAGIISKTIGEAAGAAGRVYDVLGKAGIVKTKEEANKTALDKLLNEAKKEEAIASKAQSQFLNTYYTQSRMELLKKNKKPDDIKKAKKFGDEGGKK